MADYLYIGHGVYSVAEAARLTGVPASTIRRWTRGYSYTRNGSRYKLPPVFASTEAREGPILRFVDLIEVRALRGFREKGVPWSTLRIASHKASQITGHSHPFSQRSFRTDGHHILQQVEEAGLHDIVTDAQYFENFVKTVLPDDELDFSATDAPVRWHPMGRKSTVIIDPARSFGAPICNPSGVRTRLLSRTYKAEQNEDRVAWWYDAIPREVRDAVAYEARLAA